MDFDLLQRTLSEVFEAPTWAVTRRVVEQHPELLNERVIRFLEAVAVRAETDPDVQGLFTEHARLFRRWRSRGPNEAFKELVGPKHRAKSLYLVGTDWFERFKASHDIGDLDRTVEYWRAAVEQTGVEAEEYAAYA